MQHPFQWSSTCHFATALGLGLLCSACSGSDPNGSSGGVGGAGGGSGGYGDSRTFTGGNVATGGILATVATTATGGKSPVDGKSGGTSGLAFSTSNQGGASPSGGNGVGGTQAPGGRSNAGGSTTPGGLGNAAGVATSGGTTNQTVATGVAGSTSTDWRLDPTVCLSVTEPALAKKTHPLAPTALWGSHLKSPRPTNAFWMNLVLNAGALRINLLPYQVKALEGGLSVSIPPNDVVDGSVTTADLTNLQLGASESLTGHQLTAYDDLSATVTWTASAGTLATPLVYGMPYATGLYQGLTPSVKVPSAAITQVNGSSATTATGQRLVLTLNNGQIWNLYSSSPLNWTWTSSEIHSSVAFTGSVRLALVPESGASAILDAHAGAIPTGGQVQLSQAGTVAKVEFEWQRQGQGELLMMALPHHVPRLTGTTTKVLNYLTLRGKTTAVAGNSWTLSYPVSAISWYAPRYPAAAVIAEIREALQQDSTFVPTATDPYFGGKQLAKLARLLLIARELDEPALATKYLGNLRSDVSKWLKGTNEKPLVYDTTWGGIVSAAGIASSAADFGQGYYNDHHFHYGYHAYAAAAVAREDSAWAVQHAEEALWLARDIANPCRSDPYFPRFRNFDWYVGHSWASGLFEFGDSRNQESTSEAVNAWYGVQLLGQALGNDTLAHVGAILRAVETVSAQTYWQVTNTNDIYGAPFKNHHAVGVLWSTKVDFTTFFGSNPEYIYGIQMLPFTPATEDLLSRTWITDAWPQLSAAAASATEQGWKGFMSMAHGVIDKEAALAEVRALTGYDDGNSRANTLYWMATRP